MSLIQVKSQQYLICILWMSVSLFVVIYIDALSVLPSLLVVIVYICGGVSKSGTGKDSLPTWV